MQPTLYVTDSDPSDSVMACTRVVPIAHKQRRHVADQQSAETVAIHILVRWKTKSPIWKRGLPL